MPIYIALLRGINVGSRHRIKMEPLRQSVSKLGFTDVQTYIQSGNLIFRAPIKSALKVSKALEEKLSTDFGFNVPVLSVTPEELSAAIKGNPFLKESGIDVSRLHVTFLEVALALSTIEKLKALPPTTDRFHHSGKLIYLHCPAGLGNTTLFNPAFEKMLAVRVTTRNWRTVNTLHQMSRGMV